MYHTSHHTSHLHNFTEMQLWSSVANTGYSCPTYSGDPNKVSVYIPAAREMSFWSQRLHNWEDNWIDMKHWTSVFIFQAHVMLFQFAWCMWKCFCILWGFASCVLNCIWCSLVECICMCLYCTDSWNWRSWRIQLLCQVQVTMKCVALHKVTHSQ